jgi:hypothetical protein
MTVMAVPRPEVAGDIDDTRADIEFTSTGKVEWRAFGAGEAPPMLEMVETLLLRATRAMDELAGLPLDQLDAEATELLVVGAERLRRTADAAAVAVAGHVDRTEPFRSAGFFNTVAYLKHRIQLSGPEAYQRVQMARQSAVLDRWASGHAAGSIGTAQFRLMARIAANPRITAECLAAGSIGLWCDALDSSYREFEQRALTWEMLADPVGALAKAERATARRTASFVPLDTGGWALHGRFDDIGGAEFNEIFAHFIDVESRNDWREAATRLASVDDADADDTDTGVAVADLRRTEEQRRCDALLAMARSAAANGSGAAAEPTVNFLIDHDTARSIILDEPISPDRYRAVVSRTSSGVAVHPRRIVNCAMWAHVRRVVTDAAGVVIDLGRRSRLFVGPSREAVMLLEDECAWVGCDRPTAWCDADHSVGWKAHGNTVPRNGGPLCRTHNVVKEQGYRVVRSPDGDWHTLSPDGNEIF